MVAITRFNERDLPKRPKGFRNVVVKLRPAAIPDNRPPSPPQRLALRVIGEGVGE